MCMCQGKDTDKDKKLYRVGLVLPQLWGEQNKHGGVCFLAAVEARRQSH